MFHLNHNELPYCNSDWNTTSVTFTEQSGLRGRRWLQPVHLTHMYPAVYVGVERGMRHLPKAFQWIPMERSGKEWYATSGGHGCSDYLNDWVDETQEPRNRQSYNWASQLKQMRIAQERKHDNHYGFLLTYPWPDFEQTHHIPGFAEAMLEYLIQRPIKTIPRKGGLRLPLPAVAFSSPDKDMPRWDKTPFQRLVTRKKWYAKMADFDKRYCMLTYGLGDLSHIAHYHTYGESYNMYHYLQPEGRGIRFNQDQLSRLNRITPSLYQKYGSLDAEQKERLYCYNYRLYPDTGIQYEREGNHVILNGTFLRPPKWLRLHIPLHNLFFKCQRWWSWGNSYEHAREVCTQFRDEPCYDTFKAVIESWLGGRKGEHGIFSENNDYDPGSSILMILKNASLPEEDAMNYFRDILAEEVAKGETGIEPDYRRNRGVHNCGIRWKFQHELGDPNDY